jgi:hypothetical protein
MRSASESASGRPSSCGPVTRWLSEPKITFVSNQPKYNTLYRAIEPEVM